MTRTERTEGTWVTEGKRDQISTWESGAGTREEKRDRQRGSKEVREANRGREQEDSWRHCRKQSGKNKEGEGRDRKGKWGRRQEGE